MSPFKEAIGSQHLVMRFADSLFGGVDTVEEHHKVIRARGFVWMAKMGRSLASAKIEILRHQAEVGTPTYLYLVQRKMSAYSWVRGRLADIAARLPSTATKAIPSYYTTAGVIDSAGLWLKLTELHHVLDSEIEQLRVASSGRKITEILQASMAAMFMVSKSLSTKAIKVKDRDSKIPLEDAILNAFDDDDDTF